MTYELWIYANIKKWIGEFGIDILDLLMPRDPVTGDSLKPIERYNNFLREYDKHFNMLFRFSQKNIGTLNWLAVDFQSVDDNSCDTKYDITFKVAYSNIAPPKDTDLDNRFVNLGNGEFKLLGFKDKMVNAIRCMLQSYETDEETGEIYTRTMCSDILENFPDYEYPLEMSLLDYRHYDIRVYEEILFFEIMARVQFTKSRCITQELELCED